MQVLENKHIVARDIEPDREMLEHNCRKWQEWHADPLHHWDNKHPELFQEDSGL